MPIELSRYIQDFARPITRPLWRKGSPSGFAVRNSVWFKDYLFEHNYILTKKIPWRIIGVRPTYANTTWAEWCVTKMILKIYNVHPEEPIIYGFDLDYL